MDQLSLFRFGTCADCGCEFPAGRTSSIARKCSACRRSRWRRCPTCHAFLSNPSRRFCSDECKPRCAIEGCERPRRKLDWCANHYTTWRTYGDPEREPRYRWASECRCVVCGESDPEKFTRGRKFCSANCCRLWIKHDGSVPTQIVCAQCGVTVSLLEPTRFRSRRRSDTSFCAACVRHARVNVTAADLAAEDGAVCRLCNQPVDMMLKSPDRMSPTVDHIVPRGLGGGDERSNLQLAHRGCNSSKRHLFVG